jgi:hypothetical protein
MKLSKARNVDEGLAIEPSIFNSDAKLRRQSETARRAEETMWFTAKLLLFQVGCSMLWAAGEMK